MKSSRHLLGAAAFVVVVTGCGADAAPDASLRPAAPPASAPADAAGYFRAFEQPDAAPVARRYRNRVTKGLQDQEPDLDAATFRLLRRVSTQDTGHIDFYAVVGAKTVCTITRSVLDDSISGGVGCGASLDEHHRPAVHSSVQQDKTGRFVVAALVPDAVTGLKLEFGDGTTSDLPVKNNAAVYYGALRPAELSYHYDDGSTVRDDVTLSDPSAS
jgi:hypothetical protein